MSFASTQYSTVSTVHLRKNKEHSDNYSWMWGINTCIVYYIQHLAQSGTCYGIPIPSYTVQYDTCFPDLLMESMVDSTISWYCTCSRTCSCDGTYIGFHHIWYMFPSSVHVRVCRIPPYRIYVSLFCSCEIMYYIFHH